MDRSQLDREARRILLRIIGALLICGAVLCWLGLFPRGMIGELGWEVFDPARWMDEIARTAPDDMRSAAPIIGLVIWLVLMTLMVIAPGIILIVVARRIARLARRRSRLRGFDPAAAPDLVLVRDGDDDLIGRFAGHKRRVGLPGVLERLAPDTGLAEALEGETRVYLLGDLDRMPLPLSRRLEGHLLDAARAPAP